MESYFNDFQVSDRLCIVHTLECNAGCEHCITKSTPQRREKANLSVTVPFIESCAEAGKRIVILSGGEVFLYPDELDTLVSAIAGCGMAPMVETNGFWATNDGTTRRRLAALQELGLQTLFVSVDKYHIPFIPVERVKRVATVARDLGLPCEVMFTCSLDEEADNQLLTEFEGVDCKIIADALHPFGRGSALFDGALMKPWSELGVCDSLCTTAHPSGDVYACCNITDEAPAYVRDGLRVGRLGQNSIEQIIGRETRTPLARHLTSPLGVEALVRYFGLKDRRFYSICHLCAELHRAWHAADMVCPDLESPRPAPSPTGLEPEWRKTP